MSNGARFDELIHPATRLSVVVLLAAAEWADFAFIRDRLGLSDRHCRSNSRRSRRPVTSRSKGR
jgi:hypothetical protein